MPMAKVLFGIPNCDTVREARAWLTDRGIACGFHDLRKDGIGEERLRHWSALVGWEALLNRRGTTWRGLAAEEREGLDEAGAIGLMAAHPALIRRPVVEHEHGLVVGFDAGEWKERFG